jgi:hypothetical protein
LTPEERLAELKRLFDLADQAQAKKWVAHHEAMKVEDEVCGILTKREARRVDYLRQNLTLCHQKVGKALHGYSGWHKLIRRDPKRDPLLFWKSYDELPFYWRVVGRYFGWDGGTHRPAGAKYELHYVFLENGIERRRCDF